MPLELNYYDDKTLDKVRAALKESLSWVHVPEVDDIINELHNAGILFRERSDASPQVQRLKEEVNGLQE